MKKLFLAVYFTFTLFSLSTATAAVQSFADPVQAEVFSKAKSKTNKTTERKPLPRYKSMEDLFEKRLDSALISEINEDDINSSISQNVVPSAENIEMMNENNKSFFQKVYENALNRATSAEAVYSQNVLDNQVQQSINQQQEVWPSQPDYQTVDVQLPSGSKILAPAMEHIAYLLADIDILPNGTAKINEKVIVIANGEKLKGGLSKALPKFSLSRQGERNKTDISLVSVKIDGQEVDYKIEEIGNNIIFKPRHQYELQPGVYTYDFEYIVDNQLWVYDDFNEFYWNITGNYWNLTIARAGAIIRIPGTKPELGKAGYVFSDGQADFSVARAFNFDDNTIGIASIGPIFIGESLQSIISISKDSFLPTNDNKTYRIINNYGNIILSILGLIAIVGGYFVSWVFISTDRKTKEKYSIEKTGAILRYLTKSAFDKVSFGAYLLELYKKRLIDIKKQDGKIFLVRISDNTSGMSKLEKSAVENLFPRGETLLEISKNNILKISRAYKSINTDTKNKVKKFMLKINSGYIGFSVLMLILTQLGISLLSYNPLNNFLFMLFIDLVMTGCLLAITHKTKSIWQYIYKPIALVFLAVSTVFLGAIINTISTIALIVTLLSIFIFTKLFLVKTA